MACVLSIRCQIKEILFFISPLQKRIFVASDIFVPMILKELLTDADVIETQGDLNRPITGLTFDSRQPNPQGIFFAVRGTQTDGHRFIDDAIRQGATAIVCETWPETFNEKVCYIRVADTSAAMGHIAAAFYGYPSRQLRLIGITGTNGKTTTSYILYNILQQNKTKCALIGTNGIFVDNKQIYYGLQWFNFDHILLV